MADLGIGGAGVGMVREALPPEAAGESEGDAGTDSGSVLGIDLPGIACPGELLPGPVGLIARPAVSPS